MKKDYPRSILINTFLGPSYFTIRLVDIFIWKIRNVLKPMKNQFSDFSFWDMVNFVLKIVSFFKNFEYKIYHNSRTKNRKIDFSSVQYIWIFFIQDLAEIWRKKNVDLFLNFLSWKLDHFWRGVCVSLIMNRP